MAAMLLQVAKTPCGSLDEAMTRTLSVATYLYKINLTKFSPFCTQCGQGGSQKESPLQRTSKRD